MFLFSYHGLHKTFYSAITGVVTTELTESTDQNLYLLSIRIHS